jgi:hypothetical protein
MMYLLKGADPGVCALLEDLRHENQGVVRVKRCGTSESLGARARALARFNRICSSRRGPVMRYTILFSFEQRRLIGEKGQIIPRPRFLSPMSQAPGD